MGTSNERWDVVVIGSGMGGLSAAVLLARLCGKRVLVLERHFRAGGFTHAFSRKSGYHWDVGVHYVGEVSDDDRRTSAVLSRDLFKVITGGKLRWQRMPETFEKLVFPDFEFSIRAGKENFRNDLKQAFPKQAAAIDQYLTDIERAATYMNVLGMRGLAPTPLIWVNQWLHQGARRLALQTTGEYLRARITDPRLRAVLGARWGDYGLPPEKSAFLMHALVVRHYLEGAYYPIGSACRIAETAIEVLEAHGGRVRVRAEVERILVEQGRAVGVRLTDGEVIRTPLVVSDAGARNTYLKLLPPEVQLPFRYELEATPASHAVVVLYLGLSRSPACLGIGGENYWLYDGLDHDEVHARRTRTTQGAAAQIFMSCPSEKDPEAGTHTAEIIAAVDPAAFQPWRDTPWMKRGEDYVELKTRISETLLRRVEGRFPGFGALVAYSELSTPLSSEHFTAHPQGEIYGIPVTPERFQKSYLQVRTPIKHLLLVGADASTLGVVSAAQSGLLCAVAAGGPRLFARVSALAKQPAARSTWMATSPSSV